MYSVEYIKSDKRKGGEMPRAVKSQWRSEKRRAYALLGAFSVAVPFILLSYYVFGQQQKAPSTLQLVSVVFRHGERTPTHFYPNDPYKDPKFWPGGLGALTKKGKQQMYRLGKILRDRYDDFLGSTYSPDDVYVMSSDHDRCLMSAQLCLAGLYPPVGDQVWNEELLWQPVPVHTVPRNLDKLIVVKKPCPKYEKELSQIFSSDHFIQVDRDNAALYRYLTEHSGMKVTTVAHVETLYNTLEVEANLGMKLPEWAHKIYNDNTRDLAALALAAYAFTPTAARLKGGPLLKDASDHMKLKLLGSLAPDRRFFLYSAHDLTLVTLLRALRFEALLKPDTGAALLLELHRPTNDGDHEVEVAYLNNTEHSTPVRLKIPGCDDSCKLKDFLRITESMTSQDWEAECQEA